MSNIPQDILTELVQDLAEDFAEDFDEISDFVNSFGDKDLARLLQAVKVEKTTKESE